MNNCRHRPRKQLWQGTTFGKHRLLYRVQIILKDDSKWSKILSAQGLLNQKVLRSFVCKWVIEWNRLDKNFIGFYESNLPLANQFCQKPVKKPGTDFYFVEPRYFREFCMHPLTFDSPKNKYNHKKVSENVSPMESFSNENSLVKLLKNESHVKSN